MIPARQTVIFWKQQLRVVCLCLSNPLIPSNLSGLSFDVFSSLSVLGSCRVSGEEWMHPRQRGPFSEEGNQKQREDCLQREQPEREKEGGSTQREDRGREGRGNGGWPTSFLFLLRPLLQSLFLAGGKRGREERSEASCRESRVSAQGPSSSKRSWGQSSSLSPSHREGASRGGRGREGRHREEGEDWQVERQGSDTGTDIIFIIIIWLIQALIN